MTTPYTGDPTNYPASITAPSDGEARVAASVQVPFEELADRTASTKANSAKAALNWRLSAPVGTDAGYGTIRDVVGGVDSVGQHAWIAVGSKNTTATAEAGIHYALHGAGYWIPVTGVPDDNLASVCYDESTNTWIAVGDSGSTGSDAFIITSTTKTSWTERSNPKDFDLHAVAATAAGEIVAMGEHDGTDVYAVRSTNAGATWAEIAVAAGSGSVYGIVASGTTMVAVGGTGAASLAWVSTDSGATFAAVTGLGALGMTDDLSSVTHDGSTFIVCGNQGQVMTSATGASGTWTKQSTISVQAGAYNAGTSVSADPSSGVILVQYTDTVPTTVLWISTDGGVTFARLSTQAQGTHNTGFAWFGLTFSGVAWCMAGWDGAGDEIMGAQSLAVT